MPKLYRFIFFISVVLLSEGSAFSQEAKYKEVLLDGKPAILNIETGEITLVSAMDKDENALVLKDSITIVKRAVVDSVTTRAGSDFHTVKEKETLLDIANKYNTTLAELKRLNALETTLVDEGQILRIRDIDGIEVVTDVVTIDEPEAEKEDELPSETLSQPVYTKSSTDIHIVEKGQTLFSLAKLYGLTVNDLKRYNGLSSDLIKVGQALRIANFDGSATNGLNDDWTVVKGDTLYSIAKKNGLTVEALKRINGLTSNLILVGQILRLK